MVMGDNGPFMEYLSMTGAADRIYRSGKGRHLEGGVRVNAYIRWKGVIEPGSYKSHFRRNRASRTLEQTTAAGGEITEEMKKNYEATAERELSYKEPDEVSDAFMHALFDDDPLRRYLVVPNEREQGRTISTKINELVQLNQWGPYSYSRDELVEMLDQALAGDASSY